MIDNPMQVAEERSLQPFLPMIYMAWAGAELSPSEINGLRNRLEGLGKLDDDAQMLLEMWLNPDAPPSAAQLKVLHRKLREKIDRLEEHERVSLAAVGLAMAGEAGAVAPEVAQALESIQNSLGAHGHEPVKDLFSTDKRPEPESHALSEFPVSELSEYLEAPHGAYYQRARELLDHPRFFHRYGESKDVQRERVVNWCLELAREGVSGVPWPREHGGEDNVGGFLAMAETMAAFDGSLLIKFGVHIGLFAGSIYNLGTERHHREYLPKAIAFELPGCFAMTETGHGSNVRDIETTATYDKQTQEFIIHTPHLGARKDYIGNAALHAQMATVFAQLIIDEEEFGVHAFLVPIRDSESSVLPGIQIEDDGFKVGLNGVDNGRIIFNKVRVPRENMLDKFGSVSTNGEYSSPINNSGKRFFMMLSTLVMGRVSISAAVNTMAKVGLAITVRYAEQRRQFGPAGEAEVSILDYQTYQRRLLPHLATCYALTFACKDLIKLLEVNDEANRRELESLAAGLKVYTSWHAIESLQVCRESCGGQGYLSVNRFGNLKGDTDVFATFEGSNPVLLQLVAKGLLTEFRHQFSSQNRFIGIVKMLKNKATTVITEQNPLTTRNTDQEHLRDPEFHLSAFRYREDSLLVSAARRLKKHVDEKIEAFTAFNMCQDHLVTLAQAHVERKILESFQRAVRECPHAGAREALNRLCTLFALNCIQQDSGWFLEAGYLEPVKSKAIRAEVLRLCAEVRPDARALVDAFNFTDKIISAPIALDLGEIPA
ncbi:MAG: acyl-CoA dehydrogenase [Vulcanimicrobiota bacterium]